MNQKEDLERQKKKLIKDLYPNYLMIEDIGWGVNFNKKGLKKIINLVIGGRIN